MTQHGLSVRIVLVLWDRTLKLNKIPIKPRREEGAIFEPKRSLGVSERRSDNIFRWVHKVIRNDCCWLFVSPIVFYVCDRTTQTTEWCNFISRRDFHLFVLNITHAVFMCHLQRKLYFYLTDARWFWNKYNVSYWSAFAMFRLLCCNKY